jgi:ribonuclease D
VAAAETDPRDERTLLLIPGFGGRSVRRHANVWLEALNAARALPEDQLPTTPASDGPPPPHRWAERDPVAAARLVRSREVVTSIATAYKVPAENLLAPDSVRRLAWSPPETLTPDTVGETLRELGARAWQIDLTAERLATALAVPVPALPDPVAQSRLASPEDADGDPPG